MSTYSRASRNIALRSAIFWPEYLEHLRPDTTLQALERSSSVSVHPWEVERVVLERPLEQLRLDFRRAVSNAICRRFIFHPFFSFIPFISLSLSAFFSPTFRHRHSHGNIERGATPRSKPKILLKRRPDVVHWIIKKVTRRAELRSNCNMRRFLASVWNTIHDEDDSIPHSFRGAGLSSTPRVENCFPRTRFSLDGRWTGVIALLQLPEVMLLGMMLERMGWNERDKFWNVSN